MNGQTVVVTGASGGIGRAVARAYGARHAKVALLARGEHGLAGAARDVREAGGTALTVPADVADAEQVDAAADRVERELGPIDVWVNVAFTSVFAPFEPDQRGRVPQGDRGQLPRLRVRHDGRAAVDETPRPRHHRAGRVRVGLPRHPVADRVLRRQTRHPGLPRGAALRTAARAQQRARHHGADARGEHPAVLLGAVPAAPPRPTRAADLRTRTSRRRRPVRRRPPQAPRVLGGRQHRPHPGRERHRPRAAGPLPGPHRQSRRSRPTEPQDPAAPVNLWEPADGQDGKDYGAHGIFDTRAHDTDPQLWASQHHGLLAGVAAAVTGAAAAVLAGRTT